MWRNIDAHGWATILIGTAFLTCVVMALIMVLEYHRSA